jgi:hypothetical protein
MARVGQTIEHPLSGERLTFLETAGTTGGDLLKISVEMSVSRVAWNLGDDPWRILGGGTDSFGVLCCLGVGVSV